MISRVKEFIEQNIHLIDTNQFMELFQTAIIEAELNEFEFSQLCKYLEEADIRVNDVRDDLFTDLFDQYMEVNETDYEKNDADRLEEMMDCMSTAVCLGLEPSRIIELLNKWSDKHPNRIQIEGSKIDDLKIRFLRGDLK